MSEKCIVGGRTFVLQQYPKTDSEFPSIAVCPNCAANASEGVLCGTLGDCGMWGYWVEDESKARGDVQLFGQGEEPTTCPHCGSRTDFLERDNRQLHWCLNSTCDFVFFTEPDNETDESDD